MKYLIIFTLLLSSNFSLFARELMYTENIILESINGEPIDLNQKSILLPIGKQIIKLKTINTEQKSRNLFYYNISNPIFISFIATAHNEYKIFIDSNNQIIIQELEDDIWENVIYLSYTQDELLLENLSLR